jgi:hypothetical protein
MAPGADLTAHAPPARIPKLKYRNPLPADDPSLSPELPQHIDDTRPIVTQEPLASPSSRAPCSDYQASFDTNSLTSLSLASSTSSAGSSNGSKSSKKKGKTSSVLGFWSLKEPSQVALEQYAEAQRKQAALTLSRPGTSNFAQKLPQDVPKVNSKWDGIPKSARNRYTQSSMASKFKRDSSYRDSQDSQSSAAWSTSNVSVMTDGTRNPPNSIASAAASVSSLTFGENMPVVESPSTPSLPKISYYFPEPIPSGALPAASLPRDEDSKHVPASEKTRTDSHQSIVTEPSPDSRPGSSASSTDSDDTIVRDTAEILFQKLNERPHKSFWGDAPAVQTPDENVPESHDFLFMEQPTHEISHSERPITPPPIPQYSPARNIQNFSRPMSMGNPSIPSVTTSRSSYRTTPRNSGLPTLYEASLASNKSTASVNTVPSDEDDDAYSIAPSTIAPSVLSERWYESPRERLGLGGRLRKNDILPWEEPSKSKKGRFSVFSRATT